MGCRGVLCSAPDPSLMCSPLPSIPIPLQPEPGKSIGKDLHGIWVLGCAAHRHRDLRTQHLKCSNLIWGPQLGVKLSRRSAVQLHPKGDCSGRG